MRPGTVASSTLSITRGVLIGPCAWGEVTRIKAISGLSSRCQRFPGSTYFFFQPNHCRLQSIVRVGLSRRPGLQVVIQSLLGCAELYPGLVHAQLQCVSEVAAIIPGL